jgi:hypothetical protein
MTHLKYLVVRLGCKAVRLDGSVSGVKKRGSIYFDIDPPSLAAVQFNLLERLSETIGSADYVVFEESLVLGIDCGNVGSADGS